MPHKTVIAGDVFAAVLQNLKAREREQQGKVTSGAPLLHNSATRDCGFEKLNHPLYNTHMAPVIISSFET
jgi:hypothetical protein